MKDMRAVSWGVVLITLVACMALAEIALRATRPAIWSRVGNGGLVSAPLLDDRMAAFSESLGNRRILLCLGDSVLYGSALREAHHPSWRQETVPVYLQERLGDTWRVLDLSADGLMPGDLEGLLDKALQMRPGAVVVQLNYRMLAGQDGTSSCSRPWLIGQSGGDLGSSLANWSRQYWFLYRYSEQARELLWAPTPADVVGGVVERTLSLKSPDPEEAEMIKLMRLRNYYSASLVDSANPGMQALARVARRLETVRVPVLVFLTPQNLAYVEPILDKEALAGNRAQVATLFSSRKIPYRDWVDVKPGAFLDHCHLDPSGNRQLASMVVRGLFQ